MNPARSKYEGPDLGRPAIDTFNATIVEPHLRPVEITRVRHRRAELVDLPHASVEELVEPDDAMASSGPDPRPRTRLVPEDQPADDSSPGQSSRWSRRGRRAWTNPQSAP